MPIFMSMAVAGLGLLFVNADRPLDELGCREDSTKQKYTCHSGPLAGSTFGTKEDAQIEFDFIKQHSRRSEPEVETAAPVSSGPVIKVLSWNLKRKSKEFDFDRIANVLAEADIVAIQSLEGEENGKGPLHIMADLTQSRTNQKICRAWFRTPNKERFAFLWKESAVTLIDENGELRETCAPDKAVVFGAKKDAGFHSALFFSKDHKRFFHLSSVWFDPKVKEGDLTSAFKTLQPSGWASIVAGNLQFSSKHNVFNDVKKLDFRPAMTGKSKSNRSSTENFWSRKAIAMEAGTIDLGQKFSDIPSTQIENTVSEHFPIMAAFDLTDVSPDTVQTQLLRVKKDSSSREPSSVKDKKKKKPDASKPKAEYKEPKEDLETETSDAEGIGQTTKIAASKKSKKSSKKKK